MANISKIKVGTTEYNVKDSVLNAIGLAVKAITDVSEDASTEDLAKKMNEILSKFRSLTCLAVCCGLSLFGALCAHAADPVEPKTSLHKYIGGQVEMVTNQVEWITSITNNLPQGGSGSSITDGTNTIHASGMWVTRTNATEGVAETNTIASVASASAIATNVVEYMIDEAFPDSPRWSIYGAWSLAYEPTASSKTITYTKYWTNDINVIYAQNGMTVQYDLAADLYQKTYDEYCIQFPTVTNYVCRTEGGTVTQSGHLTATSNGMYLCVAQANDGSSMSKVVPINSTVMGTEFEVNYMYDVAGSNRKTVNDEALAHITAATSAGTGTYDGKTYYKWNYFTQPAWALTSAGAAGNVKPFAIGTKLMASANHYSVKPTGTQVVGSTTVTKGAWIRLWDWALANGFSKDELWKIGCQDISIIPITSGEIPLTDLPYLMSEEQFDAIFPTISGEDPEGTGFNLVVGWCACQGFEQPVPTRLSGDYGDNFSCMQEVTWTGLGRRYDINTAFTGKGEVFPIHGGDSGHPIYFEYHGKFILTSHFTTQCTGPGYIRALPILKKYVELNGGQLRLWDE